MPLNETLCGLPAALSVIETVPLAAPFMVGAKVTLIVQELVAARDDPQLFVCENPVLAVIPEIVSAAVPLFVTVTG